MWDLFVFRQVQLSGTFSDIIHMSHQSFYCTPFNMRLKFSKYFLKKYPHAPPPPQLLDNATHINEWPTHYALHIIL